MRHDDIVATTVGLCKYVGGEFWRDPADAAAGLLPECSKMREWLQVPHASRLRVNMGNIYFEQQRYSAAIKMYRMAMDQLPGSAKELRFKVMRNIGLAFIKMGQYQDALQALNTVMDQMPDQQVIARAAFLILRGGDTY